MGEGRMYGREAIAGDMTRKESRETQSKKKKATSTNITNIVHLFVCVMYNNPSSSCSCRCLHRCRHRHQSRLSVALDDDSSVRRVSMNEYNDKIAPCTFSLCLCFCSVYQGVLHHRFLSSVLSFNSAHLSYMSLPPHPSSLPSLLPPQCATSFLIVKIFSCPFRSPSEKPLKTVQPPPPASLPP